MKTHECSCDKCRSMCERQPCKPTFDEAKALVAAGHGDRLMLDYWCGDGGPNGDEDIAVLMPASTGYTGRDVRNLWPPHGRCVFLNTAGLCEIHGPLKPLEARVALHDDQHDDTFCLFDHVISTWNNPEAQAYAETWRLAHDD